MDTPLPTITASELADRASKYAQAIVDVLDRFNEENPYPEEWKMMMPEEQAAIEKIYLAMPRHSREQRIARFEELFCLTMTNHYVIVPSH